MNNIESSTDFDSSNEVYNINNNNNNRTGFVDTKNTKMNNNYSLNFL